MVGHHEHFDVQGQRGQRQRLLSRLGQRRGGNVHSGKTVQNAFQRTAQRRQSQNSQNAQKFDQKTVHFTTKMIDFLFCVSSQIIEKNSRPTFMK